MASGPHPPRRWRLAAWLLAVLALAAVFAAYFSPHLMADLANRIWACF
ncbi:MAG: hypothetical protein HS128_00280 [Ideonella sp.]|nr:hypothetical protein [Ideonella sp.]MCC7457482.1 hypothetical protein [Nitrospira sp.]